MKIMMPDIRSVANKRKLTLCLEAFIRSGKSELNRSELIEVIDVYFSEKEIEVSDRSIERYIAKCLRRQLFKRVNGHYELHRK